MLDSIIDQLTLIFDRVIKLKSDRYAVKSEGYWTIIDNKANCLSGEHYKDIELDNINNFIVTKEANSASLIDFDGNKVLKTQYSDLRVLPSGYYIATKKITNSITLSGVIDYKENEILPFIYVSIGVDDGRLVVFLGSGSRLEYFDFYGKRITQGG